MRSLERLEQQKRLKRQKQNVPPPEEELEEEMEFPHLAPLNETRSIFDVSADKRFGGINTAPSVFDRQSAIHTDR